MIILMQRFRFSQRVIRYKNYFINNWVNNRWDKEFKV